MAGVPLMSQGGAVRGLVNCEHLGLHVFLGGYH